MQDVLVRFINVMDGKRYCDGSDPGFTEIVDLLMAKTPTLTPWIGPAPLTKKNLQACPDL